MNWYGLVILQCNVLYINIHLSSNELNERTKLVHNCENVSDLDGLWCRQGEWPLCCSAAIHNPPWDWRYRPYLVDVAALLIRELGIRLLGVLGLATLSGSLKTRRRRWICGLHAISFWRVPRLVMSFWLVKAVLQVLVYFSACDRNCVNVVLSFADLLFI